jgi:hypothetical protein
MVTISGFLRSAVAEWCPRTGPHRAGAKLPSAIGAAKPDRNAMAKLTMPNEAANALSVARAHGFVLRGQRDGFATYQEQRRSRNRHGHQKSDLARRRGAR